MPRTMSQWEKEQRGRRAEKAVARKLWWDGYRILERNFRTRSGEVDIIAKRGDTIAFVEVRSVREGSHVDPQDTVTVEKQGRIDSVASTYLKAGKLTEVTVRYDIAQVWLNQKGKPGRIEIIEAAFGDPVARSR